MRIEAAILHLERTLIQTSVQDVKTLKTVIECPAEMPMLDFITGLSNAAAKKDVLAAIEDYELKAAAKAKPAPGAEAVAAYFKKKNLPVAVVSHGCRASVLKILEKLSFVSQSDFRVILGREDLLAGRSVADPMQLAAEKMDLALERILAVSGDPIFLHAARNKGATTVLIDPSAPAEDESAEGNRLISNLEDVFSVALIIPEIQSST